MVSMTNGKTNEAFNQTTHGASRIINYKIHFSQKFARLVNADVVTNTILKFSQNQLEVLLFFSNEK